MKSDSECDIVMKSSVCFFFAMVCGKFYLVWCTLVSRSTRYIHEETRSCSAGMGINAIVVPSAPEICLVRKEKRKKREGECKVTRTLYEIFWMQIRAAIMFRGHVESVE